jgi:hypothetical protein
MYDKITPSFKDLLIYCYFGNNKMGKLLNFSCDANGLKCLHERFPGKYTECAKIACPGITHEISTMYHCNVSCNLKIYQ